MTHGYEMYSGHSTFIVQSITKQYLCMVIDGNQTYCGDHFEMYRNTESPCHIKGTNIVLIGISYLRNKKNKHIKKKKRTDLWLPDVGVWKSEN